MRNVSIIALAVLLCGAGVWYSQAGRRDTPNAEPFVTGNLTINGEAAGVGQIVVDGNGLGVGRGVRLSGSLAVDGDLHLHQLPDGGMAIEGNLNVRQN